MLETIPPWPSHVLWVQEVKVHEITSQDLLDDVVFVQDASWYPGYITGGALMAANPLMGWRPVCSISLPVYMDSSYQAELHVAWVILWAWGAYRVLWGFKASGPSTIARAT